MATLDNRFQVVQRCSRVRNTMNLVPGGRDLKSLFLKDGCRGTKIKDPRIIISEYIFSPVTFPFASNEGAPSSIF